MVIIIFCCMGVAKVAYPATTSSGHCSVFTIATNATLYICSNIFANLSEDFLRLSPELWSCRGKLYSLFVGCLKCF